ncbi:MAG: hypothetical protein J1D89_08910, partial [Agathobacter sp.]|nr:hypothetical protein [Agathobacter sp.]
MQKRLCLFMVLLLLFMSVGCGRTTPQTPETPTTEASNPGGGSTTEVVPPTEEDKPNIEDNQPV